MGAGADCPDCGSANVRKQLSVFAAHGVESGPPPWRRRRRLLRRLLRLRALRPTPAAALGSAAMHELALLADAVSGCTKCRLAEGRTQVVFGSGHPHADLMFVGEAPGFHEDKQGVPFVGQAGKLLDKLLAGIGLTRDRRVRCERAEVPASREPRSAAGRDPGVREPPLEADRADPAEGRRDARQLRDEAALRPAARDHARARPGAGDDARRQPRDPLPALPPGGRALHAADARVLETDFRRIPELLGRVSCPSRPQPAYEPPAEPAVQLGLF